MGRGLSVVDATIEVMSDPAASGTTFRSFWAQLPREGRWLLSTVAIQLFGRGLTLPFTVIYLHEVRGIGLDVAGSLMAWIFAVGVIVTGPGGAAVDKYGARRVTLVACMIHMVGVVVLAFADTLALAVVATTLMGVSGVTWPAFQAMVAAVVKGPLRQQYFGINFALVNLGIGLGGIVSGLYVDVTRPATFTTIYLGDAASMLIPIALLLGPLRHVHARADKPEDDPTVPTSYLQIARQPAMAWLLLLTFIATFVGYGQMEAGFPAFAREASEVSTRTIGWAFAANTATIVLAQFLVLRRMAGHRRTRVLVVMSIVWVAAWSLLGATGLVAATVTATIGVVLFHVLFGFGETMFQPTIPAMTNDLAPDHLRGRYNALSAGAFQIGGIAGPVMAGLLLRHDQGTAFIVILVAGCLSMIWLARALEARIPAQANGIEEEEVAATAERLHPAVDPAVDTL
jgi:MFS family permease